MAQEVHDHHKGDILTPLGVQFKRPDGSVVDITGDTIKFKMIAESDGTVKVSETSSNVTITDATNGKTQYDFQAEDVDTVGEFRAYFIREVSNEQEHFPVKTRELLVVIHDD